jgi:uncharacterized membrane protein
MLKKINHTVQSFFQLLWSIFLSGLFTVLPITLTIALFSISFRLLKSWVEPINRLYLPFVPDVAHADIILVILLIFLLGVILHFFVFKTLIHYFEYIIFRLPLVSSVYSGIKQLVFAFDPHNKVSFKKVVLVQFPRAGMYSVGFLTGEFSNTLAPDDIKNKQLLTVFVPTTPNPTTGFYVILPADEVTVIDLTQQEAMTLIISGGIIQPKRIVKE